MLIFSNSKKLCYVEIIEIGKNNNGIKEKTLNFIYLPHFNYIVYKN